MCKKSLSRRSKFQIPTRLKHRCTIGTHTGTVHTTVHVKPFYDSPHVSTLFKSSDSCLKHTIVIYGLKHRCSVVYGLKPFYNFVQKSRLLTYTRPKYIVIYEASLYWSIYYGLKPFDKLEPLTSLQVSTFEQS